MSGTELSFAQLVHLARQPANRSFELTYYRSIEIGDGSRVTKYPFTPDGIDDVLEQLNVVRVGTGVDPLHMLTYRLFDSPTEAYRELLGNNAVFAALRGKPEAVRRLTNLPDMVRELVVHTNLSPRHVLFFRPFEGSLRTFLERNGRLSAVQAMSMLRNVSGLLARLHRLQKVHGGVHEGNVVYKPGGYGGVQFVLARYASVGYRSAEAATGELAAVLGPHDKQYLLHASRSDLALARSDATLPHAAQLDLVPLGLLLRRLLNPANPSVVPANGMDPGTFSAALHALDVAATACLDLGAGFDTAAVIYKAVDMTALASRYPGWEAAHPAVSSYAPTKVASTVASIERSLRRREQRR